MRKFAVAGIVGISLLGACCAKAQQVPNAPAASTPATANGIRNLFERWIDFYREDWKGTAVAGLGGGYLRR